MTKEISKLEKAAKILNDIKQLDTSIINLERVAEILVNHETETDFSLLVKNLTPIKNDDSKTDVLDSEGNLIKSEGNYIKGLSFEGLLFGGSIFKKDDNQENKETINEKLPTDVSLAVLGVLLQYYNSKRERLIKKIQQFGFNI